jgi:Concanavalin A-like lectin/glucanases superfamily
MTSPDNSRRNAGLRGSRRRLPARPAEHVGTSFRFRPCFAAMEDRTLLASFLVTTTADSGPGSLRQAIIDSDNAPSTSNTIDFAIPGSGVQTILPQSPLPGITQAVLIDGTSQPGYAGTPLIELSGSQAGGGDGLEITCSGVIVRGLDINEFTGGAGILLTGATATGNSITANDIGTDPTGSQALPNDFGVQVLDGASDNTIGGATAVEGNLIAHNIGPGVDVQGDNSLGNQITGNQIDSNDVGPVTTSPAALQFDGETYVTLPDNLIEGSEQEETIELQFETTSGGVILGYQNTSPGPSTAPCCYVPALYVGTDGRLHGDIWQYNQVVSNVAVNDGQWHTVALVSDSASGTLSLYLDGQLVGTGPGSVVDAGATFDQIGDGFTDGWAATPGGWYGFAGRIADVRIWSMALSASQVQQDITNPPAATAQGLEADLPLDEGQGVTAYDLTSNQNNGTLSGFNGDLPTWVVHAGEAIELGDDGITYNAASPRQGPNNFQNFPVIVTTADGGLEGWLGGSAPDEIFRIDVYASAAYSVQGAGQAQDYLGSLEVTTDDQGQVVFAVPFTAPDGLPFITATATDPQGNTSEVSALRPTTLEAPTQYVRTTPGEPLIFSASLGDGIAIEDPDEGPLAAEWDVTLTAARGTISLSTLSGLVGSGDGTSTLQYSGSLSSLNAALEGLAYTQVAGSDGNFTVSLSASSIGAQPLETQLEITDGTFVVTTTADSGAGSLRQAILDSNAAGGANTISFAIAGQGIQTIACSRRCPRSPPRC